jgi:hypothetical protein
MQKRYADLEAKLDLMVGQHRIANWNAGMSDFFYKLESILCWLNHLFTSRVIVVCFLIAFLTGPFVFLCCCLQLENGVERELHFCALNVGGEWRGQGVSSVLLMCFWWIGQGVAVVLMWSGHVDVCFDLLLDLLICLWDCYGLMQDDTCDCLHLFWIWCWAVLKWCNVMLFWWDEMNMSPYVNRCFCGLKCLWVEILGWNVICANHWAEMCMNK